VLWGHQTLSSHSSWQRCRESSTPLSAPGSASNQTAIEVNGDEEFLSSFIQFLSWLSVWSSWDFPNRSESGSIVSPSQKKDYSPLPPFPSSSLASLWSDSNSSICLSEASIGTFSTMLSLNNFSDNSSASSVSSEVSLACYSTCLSSNTPKRIWHTSSSEQLCSIYLVSAWCASRSKKANIHRRLQMSMAKQVWFQA